MSDTKSPSDLSMAEILATMRRIIAEDEHAAARPAASVTRESAPADAPAAGGGEVLELTEALDEDGSVRHLVPLGGEAPRRDEEPAFTAAEPSETRTEPELPADPAPSQDRDDEPRLTMASMPADAGPEPLVSEVTSFAAAAALAHLATIPRDKGTHPSPRVGERTLEELVAELLQPLLRTWLDENLPQLVERLVQREIDRVISRSGVR